LQPDSLIPNAADPQALNRYSYVKNNPINFNDATGHKWTCIGEQTDDHCYDDGSEDEISDMAVNKEKDKKDGRVPWQKIVYNMEKSKIFGDIQAAMNYLVQTEFNNGIVNSNVTVAGTQGNNLAFGIINRYAEYCDGGAWSEECVNNFWGYHEPILKGSPSPDEDYYNDEQDALIPQIASSIIIASKSQNFGCSSGSANICHYALAKPELQTWAGQRGMDIQGDMGSWTYHQAYAPNEILHI
jgi:hypothetical protein